MPRSGFGSSDLWQRHHHPQNRLRAIGGGAMNCCVCKKNPKVQGLQLCQSCVRKFIKHDSTSKPFLDPPKPEPTPDIRGKNNNDSGRGLEIPEATSAAGVPLPKRAHA
jgi:hypothetical protein